MISRDPAEAGDFHRFRRALFPLVDAGKLGCLLQFPWGFKYSMRILSIYVSPVALGSPGGGGFRTPGG